MYQFEVEARADAPPGGPSRRFGVASLLLVLGLVADAPPAIAMADFYASHPERGLETRTFPVPGGDLVEECVIPKPLAGLAYTEAELAALRRLCRFDFHPRPDAADAADAVESEAVTAAICPKIRSSNPGIDVHEVPEGSSKKEFEDTECRKATRRAGPQVASYKQSITCSYTPSILAYYQLSRFFDGAGRVPASVLRTMSKEAHLGLVERAVVTTRGRYGPETLIRKAWEGDWRRAHANPEGAAGRPFPAGVRAAWLFSAEHEYIYGALLAGRYYRDYTEVSGKYEYATRYESFKKQAPYLRVTDPRPVDAILGKEGAARFPGLVQMKDVGDMIVLDVLLSQQDRVGNIHRRERWYSPTPEGLRVTTTPRDPETPGPVEVEVTEMVLQDNDCGVVKANHAKRNRWLDGVAHLSPTTYYRLLWLVERIADADAELETYFRRELLFTERDFARFADNVRHAGELLARRCREGALRLDLELSSTASDKADPAPGCELPADHRPASAP